MNNLFFYNVHYFFPSECGFPFVTQETESGHGIMEEPELTLTSTSDISIAEMDFANLTLEEKREDEAKSCFQVNFTALINKPQLYSNLLLKFRG